MLCTNWVCDFDGEAEFLGLSMGSSCGDVLMKSLAVSFKISGGGVPQVDAGRVEC